MKFRLLTSEGSNCAQRVRWVLAYKSMPFDILDADTLSDSEISKLSPLGTVPVLFIDDKPLSESMAIVEWLEEAKPMPALMPRDLMKKAQAREIAEIVNGTLHPVQQSYVPRFFLPNLSPEELKKYRRKWLEENFGGLLSVMDTKGPFAMGAEFTIADVFIVPIYCKALKLGMSLDLFPSLTNLLKAVFKNKEAWESCPPDLRNLISRFVS